MARSLHCVVQGKVQGVFFRSWTYDHAKALGIVGWVRNLADGKIEILAQGPDDKLDSFKALLATGSPMSRIVRVETEWLDDDETYSDFSIK
jgi:acylphosphatase